MDKSLSGPRACCPSLLFPSRPLAPARQPDSGTPAFDFSADCYPRYSDVLQGMRFYVVSSGRRLEVEDFIRRHGGRLVTFVDAKYLVLRATKLWPFEAEAVCCKSPDQKLVMLGWIMSSVELGSLLPLDTGLLNRLSLHMDRKPFLVTPRAISVRPPEFRAMREAAPDFFPPYNLPRPPRNDGTSCYNVALLEQDRGAWTGSYWPPLLSKELPWTEQGQPAQTRDTRSLVKGPELVVLGNQALSLEVAGSSIDSGMDSSVKRERSSSPNMFSRRVKQKVVSEPRVRLGEKHWIAARRQGALG